MGVGFSRHIVRPPIRALALLLAAAALAACTSSGTVVVTPLAAATQSTPATAANTEPVDAGMVVQIDEPRPGAAITSPYVLRGRLTAVPRAGSLVYRILDAENVVLGTGTIPTTGAVGKPGTFAVQMLYSALGDGPGFIQILQRDQGGSIAALGTAVVHVTKNITTPPTAEVLLPTPAPANDPYPVATSAPLAAAPTGAPQAGPQAITISSPAPGTTVGSPVTISGSTTRFPAQGVLHYRFRDGAGKQLGAGTLPVSGSSGQPASFTASLGFTLPPGGGPVRFEVSDDNDSASSAIALVVAPPASVVPQQGITITSPAPGTTVGSPMTVTGSALSFPRDGNLSYQVLDGANRQIGVGLFPVSGGSGQAASFVAALTFAPPPGGGDVRVEISDRASDGTVLARSVVVLQVAPQPPPPTATAVPSLPTAAPAPAQTLQVTAPISGSLVTMPLTITGTTAAYPSDGNLFYRVLDEAGAEIGSGTFNVEGAVGQPTHFNGPISYTVPAPGTTIRVQLLDRNDRSGTVGAQVEVRYRYEPGPYPPPR